MNSDVKALVLDWTDAFNRHDPDGYADYMAEDCVFTNVGTGTRLLGRDARRADLAHLIAVWSDVHVEVINLLIEGD